jgi:ACS family glucarate transporter-like MFS transporter
MTPRANRSLGTGIPVRYLLVAWLGVLSAVGYLDRTNISIAGMQIGREFGVGNTQLGWIFSAFLIGYAGLQIPAGLLAKRLGPRLVLALGVIWWGVFTGLTACVPAGIRGAVLLFVIVRFALGAGEAMIYPAASLFVERWMPIQERGRANGIIFAGVGIGSGLTPPLVTAIILLYGWRASFWISALIGGAAGLVWFLVSRDSPEVHPLVSQEEQAFIEAGRNDAPLAPGAAGFVSVLRINKTPWSRIFRNKSILVLTLSYFCFGYIAWMFFAWFYIYLAQERGLDLKSSALYSMLPFMAMTIGCLLGGVVSDSIVRRHGLRLGRCLVPGVALASTAALLVLGSRAHGMRFAGITLACGAGALYLSQSAFWAVAADVAGEYAGVVSGMMNMGAQTGSACTASLTPWIAAHFGWEKSFGTAAALAVVGALAWIAIHPSRTLFPLATDASSASAGAPRRPGSAGSEKRFAL